MKIQVINSGYKLGLHTLKGNRLIPRWDMKILDVC